MSRWRSAVPASIVVLVAACVDAPTRIQAPAEGPVTELLMTAPPTTTFGLDAHYAAMAREIPGFAGAYYDGSGRLVVRMAGRDLAAAESRVREELRAKLRVPTRQVRRDGPMMAPPGEGMIVRAASFDYRQLVDFRERAHEVFGLPGAVYTDIDERANRVAIGLESGADRAAFLRTLEARGVPAEAVRFTEAEPVEPIKGDVLTDRVQPLGGGLQLVFPHPVPGFISLCTLGFNVDRAEPGRSVNYFITNSHCSMTQGATDNTPYYQQPIAAPNEKYLAAHEVLDPAYFPCGGPFVCRFSDAAMARYERNRTPVDHDAIYRTESVNTGSLTINTQGPRTFGVVGEVSFPLGGETLGKVGRTTGWTEGPVIITCGNFLQAGSNRVILCQDVVAAASAGGDSGSPVFMRHGDTRDVTLYGVLWGGGAIFGVPIFVFSAMDNIRFELGPFRLYFE